MSTYCTHGRLWWEPCKRCELEYNEAPEEPHNRMLRWFTTGLLVTALILTVFLSAVLLLP